MNIALCTDEKYSFPCGVCITSVLENNKGEVCNIYIMTTGLERDTINKFERLGKIYKQKIKLIILDDKVFEGLKICDRFPKSIYFRFLLPQLLKVDKVLYLDCDIIVTNSLRELWETEIEDFACGVVEDQKSDDIRIQNRFGLYKRYFNSGVLLINLEYWRKEQTADKLVEFINKNPEKCVYPDQDALNYLLHDKVKFLEYKYNYQEFFYLPKEDTFLHKNKWHNLLDEGEIPVIIHYTNYTKPWITSCNHPQKHIFMEYQSISLWKNHKIKSPYTIKGKIAAIIKHFIHILKL